VSLEEAAGKAAILRNAIISLKTAESLGPDLKPVETAKL
jgi:hypothetical protein